jgi:hypothetical protein
MANSRGGSGKAASPGSTIRDPGEFFAVLGEVIVQRIDEHADYLAGDGPPGEGYLAKVARLTAAREYAKERVLSEYLLLPPDEARPTVADRLRLR